MGFLVLSLTGCLAPLPDKVSAGHKYKQDSLAFLNYPDVTRAEVVATLGPPLYESSEKQVMIYEWQQTGRFLAVEPELGGHEDTSFHFKEEKGGVKTYGMFIAYDEKGALLAHEVRLLSAPTPEDAVAQWANERSKK